MTPNLLTIQQWANERANAERHITAAISEAMVMFHARTGLLLTDCSVVILGYERKNHTGIVVGKSVIDTTVLHEVRVTTSVDQVRGAGE